MTYQEAKERCAAIEVAYKAACDNRAAIEAELAATLGIDPRNGIGLTADAIKFHPRYRTAKQNQDLAFRRLQESNRAFVKAYKKEIQAERRARYAERTA